MTWVLKTLENEQKQSVHGKEIILERDNSDLKKKKRPLVWRQAPTCHLGQPKFWEKISVLVGIRNQKTSWGHCNYWKVRWEIPKRKRLNKGEPQILCINSIQVSLNDAWAMHAHLVSHLRLKELNLDCSCYPPQGRQYFTVWVKSTY